MVDGMVERLNVKLREVSLSPERQFRRRRGENPGGLSKEPRTLRAGFNRRSSAGDRDPLR